MVPLQRSMKWMHGMIMKFMPMMITCQQFEDFVLEYFEDELPQRQKFVFELHLKVCRECRDYLAAYKRTIELSKRVFDDPDQPVPDAVPEELVQAILAARQN